MTIKASFLAGTDIERAGEEAIAFSKKHNVDVSFDFNGAHIFVVSSMTVDSVVTEYHNQIKYRR